MPECTSISARTRAHAQAHAHTRAHAVSCSLRRRGQCPLHMQAYWRMQTLTCSHARAGAHSRSRAHSHARAHTHIHTLTLAGSRRRILAGCTRQARLRAAPSAHMDRAPLRIATTRHGVAQRGERRVQNLARSDQRDKTIEQVFTNALKVRIRPHMSVGHHLVRMPRCAAYHVSGDTSRTNAPFCRPGIHGATL